MAKEDLCCLTDVWSFTPVAEISANQVIILNQSVRGERAQWWGCRKTSVFLSRETGISGNFVGRIKGAKCPFDLQFLTWDFS